MVTSRRFGASVLRLAVATVRLAPVVLPADRMLRHGFEALRAVHVDRLCATPPTAIAGYQTPTDRAASCAPTKPESIDRCMQGRERVHRSLLRPPLNLPNFDLHLEI